jgi:hypothetical protein
VYWGIRPCVQFIGKHFRIFLLAELAVAGSQTLPAKSPNSASPSKGNLLWLLVSLQSRPHRQVGERENKLVFSTGYSPTRQGYWD